MTESVHATRMILASTLLAAVLLLARPAHAALVLEFQEDLGNFPDAIAVGGGVASVGGQIGVLFTLTNTSYAGGTADAFQQDPDGDFATKNDTLTADAATAIADGQPYGIYKFSVKLPESFNVSGILGAISTPGLFDVSIQENISDVGFDEYNFTVNVAPHGASGLLFDAEAAAAGVISPTLFTNPVFGPLEFFIPALYTSSLDTLAADIDVQIRNSPGLDISTSMAWEEDGRIVTSFDAGGTEFDGERLRPRGEIQGVLTVKVPVPGSLALFGLGLGLLGWVLARRR